MQKAKTSVKTLEEVIKRHINEQEMLFSKSLKTVGAR